MIALNILPTVGFSLFLIQAVVIWGGVALWTEPFFMKVVIGALVISALLIVVRHYLHNLATRRVNHNSTEPQEKSDLAWLRKWFAVVMSSLVFHPGIGSTLQSLNISGDFFPRGARMFGSYSLFAACFFSVSAVIFWLSERSLFSRLILGKQLHEQGA
ncbi:MAG: hypothetical protein AAF557_27160 [Pseudomonadota bacterium]